MDEVKVEQNGGLNDAAGVADEKNSKVCIEPCAPYAAGTGSVPVGPDRAAFERMSYRERLAFKREDPQGYAMMKG